MRVLVQIPYLEGSTGAGRAIADLSNALVGLGCHVTLRCGVFRPDFSSHKSVLIPSIGDMPLLRSEVEVENFKLNKEVNMDLPTSRAAIAEQLACVDIPGRSFWRLYSQHLYRKAQKALTNIKASPANFETAGFDLIVDSWLPYPTIRRQKKSSSRKYKTAVLPLFHTHDSFHNSAHVREILASYDSVLCMTESEFPSGFNDDLNKVVLGGVAYCEPLVRSSDGLEANLGVRNYALIIAPPSKVPVQWVNEFTANLPNNLTLLVVGPGWPRMHNKRLIQVEYLDRFRLRHAMKRAKAVLVPSLSESFSYVAVDALVLGTPIIVHQMCSPTAGLAKWSPLVSIASTPRNFVKQLESVVDSSDIIGIIKTKAIDVAKITFGQHRYEVGVKSWLDSL